MPRTAWVGQSVLFELQLQTVWVGVRVAVPVGDKIPEGEPAPDKFYPLREYLRWYKAFSDGQKRHFGLIVQLLTVENVTKGKRLCCYF